MMRKLLIITYSLVALLFSWKCFADSVVSSKAFYLTSEGNKELIPVGDEFGYWFIDELGNKYTVSDNSGTLVKASGSRLRQRRNNLDSELQLRKADNKGFSPFGDCVIPVILVTFKDKSFSVYKKYGYSSNKAFYEDVLNGTSSGSSALFSAIDIPGSVADYWQLQSMGLFRPKFKIFEATVSRKESFYGDDGVVSIDVSKKTLFSDSISKIKTDLVSYLNNNASLVGDGGVVKCVLCIFAGAGQNTVLTETSLLWPAAYTYKNNYSGISFASSALISEYYNSDYPNVACFCHEFGHCIGLPDFYDVDVEENGTVPENDLPGEFSLMCGGSHRYGGRLPCNLNSVEREMLWPESVASVNLAGTSVFSPWSHLNPPSIVSGKFFKVANRSGNGEYLYIECRDNSGWDLGLIGPVCYHVDMSNNNVVSGGPSAASLWDDGYDINSYGSHPCFRRIRSDDNYVIGASDWSGVSFGYFLDNMSSRSSVPAENYFDFFGSGYSNFSESGKVCVIFILTKDFYTSIKDKGAYGVNCSCSESAVFREYNNGQFKGYYCAVLEESVLSKAVFIFSKDGYETLTVQGSEIASSSFYHKGIGYCYCKRVMSEGEQETLVTLNLPDFLSDTVKVSFSNGPFSLFQRFTSESFREDCLGHDVYQFSLLHNNFAAGGYDLKITSNKAVVYEGHSLFDSVISSSDCLPLFSLPKYGILDIEIHFNGDCNPTSGIVCASDSLQNLVVLYPDGREKLLGGCLPVSFLVETGTKANGSWGSIPLMQGIILKCNNQGIYYLDTSKGIKALQLFVNGQEVNLNDCLSLLPGMNKIKVLSADNVVYETYLSL